jgi:hypothetical protein
MGNKQQVATRPIQSRFQIGPLSISPFTHEILYIPSYNSVPIVINPFQSVSSLFNIGGLIILLFCGFLLYILYRIFNSTLYVLNSIFTSLFYTLSSALSYFFSGGLAGLIHLLANLTHLALFIYCVATVVNIIHGKTLPPLNENVKILITWCIIISIVSVSLKYLDI